jgi:alpha-D-xyloside xylohydrolase
VVLLVKDHAIIPHVTVAQSTTQIDWGNVELRVFSTDNAPARGLFSLPQGDLHALQAEGSRTGLVLRSDPLAGRVKWRVTRAAAQ